MLRTPDTDASADEDEAADLSVGLHTRISPRAEEMLKERARQDGVKPATWARIAVYKALGLLTPGGRSPRRGRR